MARHWEHETYAYKDEHKQHLSTSDKLKRRTDEYLNLRALMRDYFRDNDMVGDLPKKVRKAIGIKNWE